jgi:hypothetical protein
VFATRQVPLRLVREGGEWVARTEFPQQGDVVLRFRASSGGAGSLTGAIAGTGITAQGIDDAVALGVKFSGSDVPGAQVSGSALPTRPIATGRITGKVEFIDMFRPPLACSTTDWMLTPDRL